MLVSSLFQRLRPIVTVSLARSISGEDYNAVDWYTPALRYLRYIGVDIPNSIRLYKRLGKTKYFTRDNVADVVEFFDNIGVRGTSIKDAIICAPDILRVPIETLEARACWYREIFNFSYQEFRVVLELYPNLLEDKATTRFEEALHYFKTLGISRDQYRAMLVRCPTFLKNPIQELISISKTVEFFLTRGVEKSVVVEAIVNFPEMLNYSLMGHILPKAYFFETELEITQERFADVFIRNAWVLGLNLESEIRHTVQWLLDFGAEKSALGNVVLKFPSILGFSVENNFKPKVDYFVHYLGTPFGELALLIEKYPAFMGISLKEHVRPFVWCLEYELSMPVNQIHKVFLKAPELFGIPYAAMIKPTIDYFLEELQCRRDLLCKMVLAFPRLLCYPLEDNIKPRIEWLKGTVGVPKEKMPSVALHRLYPYSIETLNNKLHFVRSQLDIGHEEIVAVICSDASFFHKSLSNLAKKIQFVEQDLKMKREKVVDCPPFLGFSLETRIRPRTAFLVSLNKEPAAYTLQELFDCPDAVFVKRIGNTSEESYESFKQQFSKEREGMDDEDQEAEEQMMDQTFVQEQSLSPIEQVREAERRFARNFRYQHVWD